MEKYRKKSYDQWLGENAGISQRDILRMTIDAALRMWPNGFDALMQFLEDAGYRMKRAAQISIRPSGGKRFIRLDTLGPDTQKQRLKRRFPASGFIFQNVPEPNTRESRLSF